MLVSVDDVAAQMGAPLPLAAVAQRRLEFAIGDAEAMLVDHFGDLSGFDPDRLARVIRWAVAEWAAQPGAGVVSQETSVDDARTATRWENGARESLRDVLARYWGDLAPQFRRRRGAFTISPSYQPGMRRWPR